MKARLIYNPTAGQEQFQSNLPDCLDILESHGIETSVYRTKAPLDGRHEAARVATSKKYDIVIASGGDGTVKEVIEGLTHHDTRPSLAIIPSGTSNDMATSLGLPIDCIASTKVITAGFIKAMDVLKTDDNVFMNVAAHGMFTEVSYRAKSELKTALGRLAYYLKGIESLPKMETIHLNLASVHGSFTGEALFFMVANSPIIGGAVFSPGADPFDGLFDVTVIPQMSVNQLLYLGRLFLQQRHFEHPQVINFKTDRLTVGLSNRAPLNLDGEYAGDKDSHCVTILPGHLNVLLPSPY